MAVLSVIQPRTGPTVHGAIGPSQGLDDRRGPNLSRFLRTITVPPSCGSVLEAFRRSLRPYPGKG